MTKLKIYELSKELNTSSKRLMEKLAEIGINVKNHMSYLEDHELDALYKHIGFKKHEDSPVQPVKPIAPEISQPANPTAEFKKPAAPHIIAAPVIPHAPHIVPHSTSSSAASSSQHPVAKTQKSAPTIVRKREIIVDTPSEYKKDSRQEPRGDRGDVRIRKDDGDSGLRPGFVRDSMSAYKSNNKPQQSQAKKNEPAVKPAAAANAEKPKQPEQAKTPIAAVEVPAASESSKQEIKKVVAEAPKAVATETPAPEIKAVEVKAAPVEPKAAEPKAVETKPDEIKAAPPVEEAPKTEAPQEAKPSAPAAADTATAPKASETAPRQDARPERPQSNYDQSRTRQTERIEGQSSSYGQRPQGGQGGGYNRDRGPSDQYRGSGQAPYRSGQPAQQRSGDRPDRGSGSTGPGRYGAGGNSYSTGGGLNSYGSSGPRPSMANQLNKYGTTSSSQSQSSGSGNRYGNSPRPASQGGGYQGGQGGGYQGGGPRRDGTSGYQNRDGGAPRPASSGNRYGGGQGSSDSRYPQAGRFGGAERPKTPEQIEEIARTKPEPKRESLFKVNKDVKRDDKKEQPRTPIADKPKKFVADKTITEKKGVHEVMSDEFVLDDMLSGSDKAKRLNRNRRPGKDQPLGNVHIPHKAVLTSIKIPETLTVKDLAESLKKTSSEIIKKLMSFGQLATLNQEIDIDTATIIAEEYGVKVEKELVINEEDILFENEADDDQSQLVPRPPVVVVMGHVDHGKTSLLDAIRKTNVIDSEAGGITQHIGAYMVKIHDRDITFLDTPGHEAFTSMRARGAQVTDIAVLVVAADDGIMPQTVEAINHAKAANVKIIVAINKIDKPGADPDRVRQELTKYELLAEEWGGDTICVNVSAKKGENIDKLLEMITLVADMLELKSNPDKQARGTIIEARLDKGKGPIATVLVQRGTLKVGDSIVTGTTVGRIRAMIDDRGMPIKEAGPSTPVEIQGLPEVPEAGETFHAIRDEKIAKQLAEKRKLKNREQTLKAAPAGGVTLDDLFTQIQAGKVKDLNIIVKADVQGSVEAVKQSLEKLSNDEVKVRIIHGGVGAITESDISLASVSSAIIIGFNVRPSANVAEIATEAGVDIRLYRVIYNAIEDIEAAMKGMLEPTFKEVVLGQAEIRQIFKVSGIGTIAGCHVTQGKIVRNSDVRVIRDGIVIHEGKLASLKRFKDDAKEVAQGFECGLSIDKFNDIKEADVVESYMMEEVKR